jgi:hypothetical protein
MTRSPLDTHCVVWIAFSFIVTLPLCAIQADDIAHEVEESFHRAGVLVVSGQIQDQRALCLLDTGFSRTGVLKSSQLILNPPAIKLQERIHTNTRLEIA